MTATDLVEGIDVEHLGMRDAICCYRVGDVIIDPGPEVSRRRLLARIASPPRAILLTHIHFDHAGAAGALLREWPETELWVHERGARHLIAPERLVSSARTVFGDDFARLWGEVVPADPARVRTLHGGERILGFRVEHTPGHATHHVAYLHESTGVAFVGDVAGVRIGDGPVVLPTPPPDVDLRGWAASLRTIAGWRPLELALTHFGRRSDVDEHIAGLEELLATWPALVTTLDAGEYAAMVRRSWASSAWSAAYDHATPPDTFWAGIRGDRSAAGTALDSMSRVRETQ